MNKYRVYLWDGTHNDYIADRLNYWADGALEIKVKKEPVDVYAETEAIAIFAAGSWFYVEDITEAKPC